MYECRLHKETVVIYNVMVLIVHLLVIVIKNKRCTVHVLI